MSMIISNAGPRVSFLAAKPVARFFPLAVLLLTRLTLSFGAEGGAGDSKNELAGWTVRLDEEFSDASCIKRWRLEGMAKLTPANEGPTRFLRIQT
ncbi:MAG: hypothetical protein ACREF9_19840, partial [Opitutaceae bacterium]